MIRRLHSLPRHALSPCARNSSLFADQVTSKKQQRPFGACLTALNLLIRLFFYAQSKDIDSHHWIEPVFSWRLNTGATEGRRHVAQPLPDPAMSGSGYPN